mmetsp:Transcript_27021/g.68378  ORF Transcript_27021/g.68378 Transcript_27021/m.68378 type:complete len:273 (-) Transcript_27021:96-914(-)
MAIGANVESECSPCLTPPRVARAGGDKACQCKLLVEVDGVMVSPCKGWGLQMAQQSGSLHGHADRPTLLRMLYTGLGFDKQNASDADEAEMILAHWTGDAKGTGNYKVSVFHFDALAIYFKVKTVALSKLGRQIWPFVEPKLVRARTRRRQWRSPMYSMAPRPGVRLMNGSFALTSAQWKSSRRAARPFKRLRVQRGRSLFARASARRQADRGPRRFSTRNSRRDRRRARSSTRRRRAHTSPSFFASSRRRTPRGSRIISASARRIAHGFYS